MFFLTTYFWGYFFGPDVAIPAKRSNKRTQKRVADSRQRGFLTIESADH